MARAQLTRGGLCPPSQAGQPHDHDPRKRQEADKAMKSAPALSGGGEHVFRRNVRNCGLDSEAMTRLARDRGRRLLQAELTRVISERRRETLRARNCAVAGYAHRRYWIEYAMKCFCRPGS